MAFRTNQTIEESLEDLTQFYEAVDARAHFLANKHVERLNCRKGCAGCCIDGVTVWSIEAENIRQTSGELLKNEAPNENGGCAFLDQTGACRIYESRPFVCRTQGLPLRWFDEVDEETYELRDICPLNDFGEPIEELNEDDCWTIGEFEHRLADLQTDFQAGEMKRIALRKLFDS